MYTDVLPNRFGAGYTKLIPLFAGAAAITFGLFFAMQLLIQTDYEVTKREPVVIADIVMPDRVMDDPIRNYEKPQPLIEPPQMPELIRERLTPKPGPVIFTAPTPKSPVGGGVFSGGINSRDVLVRVQIRPTYPVRALNNGIEGFVDLAFTVTEIGAVTDIRVIAAEPEGVFDQAAMRALQRWKYEPKKVEGKAVARKDMETRISFRIQQ